MSRGLMIGAEMAHVGGLGNPSYILCTPPHGGLRRGPNSSLSGPWDYHGLRRLVQAPLPLGLGPPTDSSRPW